MAAVVVLVGIVSLGSRTTQAGPVTFRFNALIDNVGGIPFNLGLDFAVGDEITGSFTFDPQEGDGDITAVYPQNHQLLLEINGRMLATSNFEVFVGNNVEVIDYPFANQVDMLSVQCGNSPEGCAPGIQSLAGGDPFRLGIGLSLRADTAALEMLTLPSELSIWNDFGFERQLSVAFANVDGGGVVFQATVGQFLAVPEQSSLTIASLLAHDCFYAST
jgi:hypothetical protein